MRLNRRTFVAGGAAVSASALAACQTAGQTTGQTAAQIAGPAGPEADPLFNQPYVDVDEWRDTPYRHRYVHGGFTGTGGKFLILFPPKEQYQGRFFQHNTAIPTSELQAGNIFGGDFSGFCFDSGAASVVTNQGGFENIAQHGSDARDPSIGSYRVAAAAARYTRVLAQEMYGAHRCYGYAFGGSGGAYRTLSGAEHTDAWDGVVPYIHGNMAAWPNGYAGRARAQRTLKDKFPVIADALEPGGGDVYAGLNTEERGILEEITKLGFPIRAWTLEEAMGVGPLTVLFQGIQTLDPTYFEEFWTTPGYLGHDSPQSFQDVRLQHRTKVKRVIRSNEAASVGLRPPGFRVSPDPDIAWRNFQADYGEPLPVALELEDPPPAGSFLDMANINVVSGQSAGHWLVLGGMTDNFARLQFSPAGGSLREITDNIQVGDEVQVDNSNILAYETYYRHALLSPDYYVGNQFRHADGAPIYPQRPRLIALDLMKGATPTIPSGVFGCKMIVIQNLLDWDAQPWYADWYRTKVKENLGDRFGDNYRLYYTDYATHGSMPDPTRTVSYSGALQQALRDLAAWVEGDVAPPDETSYRVENGQVIVPPMVAERGGVQPVVTLTANGGERADVKVGEAVAFTGRVETPSGAGSIVDAEWDFIATEELAAGEEGRFAIAEQLTPAPHVTLSRSYTFTEPGVYYPALRVHAQRQGDAMTPYGRIANLGRVRVVVT